MVCLASKSTLSDVFIFTTQMYSTDDDIMQSSFEDLPVEILLYIYSFLPGRSVLLSMTASKHLLSVAASYLLTDGLDNQTAFQTLELSSADLATLLRYTSHPLSSLSLYNIDQKIIKPAMGDIKECVARNIGCFDSLHLNCKDISIKILKNTFAHVLPNLRTLSLKSVTSTQSEQKEFFDMIAMCTNLENLKLGMLY
jgi:hypothetical protein